MITIPVGKALGQADLTLIVRDAQGAPTTPHSINYSIFAMNPDGSKVPVSEPRKRPTLGTLPGLYYVDMTMPTSWADGHYTLVWYVLDTPEAHESSIYEEFAVLHLRPEAGSMDAPSVLLAKRLMTTEKVAETIMQVRELLSDTNPDRNYHFRPPTAAKTVAGYTTRVGFIWTDETIMRLLKLSLAQINTANPKALYGMTLDTMDENWAQAAALGAASKCLNAEAARWISDEFGYSLNGVSLDLEKSGKYQGLAAAYQQEFQQWLVPLTANRPKSVGLRQNPWLR